jgi:photosystem II stability/assembly factor-like uncharacterized protein
MVSMKRTYRRFAGAAVVAALSVLALIACALPAAAQAINENTFKGMKWRLVGPFRGGRVLAVTGVEGNTKTYYFGAVAGGVWKTVNGGVTWTPVFDKQSIASIGAIAVAPSDANVIYAGTGEACIRGNISYGNGVYKSLDGGKTWTHVGLADTRHIAKVLVDPRNPDVVFVAALGHAYGPNAERGVFRSTDGGKTWQKVLYKGEKTGAIDLGFDPANSHILYAALWEATRTPWSMTSGGPGSGLYKSTDGGATWKRVEGHGLPGGVLGRIGVAVSGADSNRVYTLIEAAQGGLYRSDDAGESWRRINDDHRFTQRAWYFHHIFADPKAVDTLYILNTGLFRSIDGGRTFTTLSAPHGDHHGLWIDPADPQRMINGNDGGATITIDGGKSWTPQTNQPTAQFYHVAADTRFPYYVYGAQQDNSTVAIASRSDRGTIDRPDWYPVGGGESGYVVPDPRDPNVVYAGSYDGLITRFDKRTGQALNISAWPLNPMGSGAAELKHRFQWTAPIAVSPHDPNVLYHGAEVLFRSTDGGMSWAAISPDLTRNDKSKQQSSGGPITKDNTSVEYYDTIFAVAESPREKGLIWVGTDDGWVHVTRDAGKTWTNVTPKGMPEWSMISIIDASPHDAATAYVAVDRHRSDDFRPYIYKTSDYGKSWTKITNGLPDNSFVHAVREDPKRKGLLFAGTETGVYVSFDDGARWQSLQMNLPTAPMHDLLVKDADLVVATHGRSFWILDDITPLRQFSEKAAGAEIQLYEPAPAYRFRGGGGFQIAPDVPVGVNPPAGAVIDYYLKVAPKDAVTLEILDAQDKLVRRYWSQRREEAEAPPEFPEPARTSDRLTAVEGLNRFVWDLRYEPPARVPGAVSWGGRPVGPVAVPGNYQVKLTLGGASSTAKLEIKADPRVAATQADLERQLDLGLKIRELLSRAHGAVNQIRGLRVQLDALHKRLAGDVQQKDLTSAAEDLNKKMAAVEEALIQVKSKSSEDPLNYPIMLADQLMALGSSVDSADSAPTQVSYVVFEELGRKIGAVLAKWDELREKDLPALNDKAQKANVPTVSIAPAGSGGAPQPPM